MCFQTGAVFNFRRLQDLAAFLSESKEFSYTNTWMSLIGVPLELAIC